MQAGFAGVVVALMLLAGCTIRPMQQPEQTPTIRYVNFRVYDPVYVALERGYFAERGIDVDIIGDVLGGPTAIQAVAGGSAEAGLSSLPALINANASGLSVVGVSDIQSAIGSQPLEEFFVSSASDIHSIADLRGKTVAVNLWRSSFHYTILIALEQAGVPEDEVQFVLVPFENQPGALENGQVAMIGLMEPYASQARALYGDEFQLLFTALDVFGERQFTTHFVNSEWAAENPDKASAFVGGIVDAIEWIEANPAEARPIIARYTGIAEQHIPDYQFQPDGRVVMADVRFWLDYIGQRGDADTAGLEPEDIATNRFNSRLDEP
jgi:NitT/TauT family transport system substrate-binding protein